MRYPILLLTVLLVFGCSSKSTHEDSAAAIVKSGMIKTKENVSRDDVEADSNVNTSVYASFSSGGRVSIGLGFLFFPFTSSSSDEELVRYQVDFEDGGQITIYHESRNFQVDDCVEITVYPDEEKEPPKMVRKQC